MVWPGTWPTHLLHQSRLRLVELQQVVDEINPDASSATEGALTRFLVVRACGHIEFTFDEAFCLLAESRASPAVGGFVRSHFFRGANPSAERIAQTLRRFEPLRADRFESFADEDDCLVKRELAFLIDRRNKIAHGQSETVVRRKALDLADVALRVGDWLVAELDPR